MASSIIVVAFGPCPWPNDRLWTLRLNFISVQKMLKAFVGSEPFDKMKTKGVKFDESL